MLNATLVASLLVLTPSAQPPAGPVLFPPKDRLVLPSQEQKPTKPTQVPVTETQEAAELNRFTLEVEPIKVGILANEAALELELRRLSALFASPAKLALEKLKNSDHELSQVCARILRRFGTPDQADPLLLLLLTRPFGLATREVVETEVALAGDRSKEVLLRLLKAPYPGLQLVARDLVAPRLEKEDLETLIALTRDKKVDPAMRGIELLGRLKVPEATARLVELLSTQDATFAQVAAQALIVQGTEAVPAVSAILTRPARDYSFPWAAFVLTQLEEKTGERYLTEAMVPTLKLELGTIEPFFQVTAALALARLALRSNDITGTTYADAQIVDALLQVTAPRGFVLAFALLERPAANTLALFTGRELTGAAAWRQWWTIAREGFVGNRQRIEVTPQNAAFVSIVARNAREEIRVIGEQVTSVPEAGAAQFCMLDAAQMVALLDRLKGMGLMGEQPRRIGPLASVSALPDQQVVVELGRSRVASGFLAERVLQQIVVEIGRTLDAQRWQLYRDPRQAADFTAFWRAERAWLAAHSDPVERAARLKDQILRVFPILGGKRRLRALDDLTTLPDLAKILTEEDGGALVAVAGTFPEIDDVGFRVLELALMARGDKVWRQALEVVDKRFDQGGKASLPRFFHLLGADKVLAAVEDPRPRIRLAAIEEVATTKDLRAVGPLLDIVTGVSTSGKEVDLRRAAIESLGKLRATAAREPLLRELPTLDEATRRKAWIALGRIGGQDSLDVLRSALLSPIEEDRMAAVQGIGELKDQQAARLLAEFWVKARDPRVCEAAREQLKRQGALIARPALKPFLPVADSRRRPELVALLAEFQEPEVVPYLVDALIERGVESGALLWHTAIVTGVDLTDVNDRSAYLSEWWRTHKELPQSAWYLELLRREKVDTSLRSQDLVSQRDLVALPELLRILQHVNTPRVRALTLAMLRDVTQQDFGTLQLGAPEESVRALVERYRFWAEEKGKAARK